MPEKIKKEKAFSLKEAADWIGISEKTLKKDMNNGLVEWHLYGDADYRIYESDLFKYKERCKNRKRKET